MRFLILCIVSFCFLSTSHLNAQTLRLYAVPTQWQSLQIPLESWGAVGFEVLNTGDEGRDVFVTSYFEQNPDQQFGRQFWIPPHSIRHGWYLVKTPPTDGSESTMESKALLAMLIGRQGNVESAEATEAGKRSESTYIRCPKSPAKTLLITDNENGETVKLVTAARTTTAKPDDFRIISTHPLPPVAAAYEGWTHIILASNRVLEDPATVEALRQWTVQGGRLWILLDKSGMDAARPFLADAGGLSEIDRVGLNSFELVGLSKKYLVGGHPRELEIPVDMVRTVSEGFHTLYQVNGWDAAMTTPVGKGFVLITTLGPSAWLKPKDNNSPSNWNKVLSESGYPTPECTTLGEQFWGLNEAPPSPDLAPIATQYVGYPVMSFTRVTAALAIFCISILAGALLLWRADRLTWLAWFAPVVAVLGTLWIGTTSYQNRSSIPATEATIQVAESDSLGNLHIQGGMSVYSQSNGDTDPQTTLGGQLEFVKPPPGQLKRLVWTDYGKVHWENLNLNTGVHEFVFQNHLARKPSHAIFSFDEDGVTGRIVGGEWGLPERGLIVSPSGQFAAPRFLPDAHLVSTASDQLAPGRFSASDVIDDREQTRMAILEKVFAKEQRLPSQPRLYFWTDPLDAGFQTLNEGRRVGDALVGLPILYERPAAGSDVFCPSYLIDFRSVPHPRRGQSLAYSNMTRQWNEMMVRKAQTTFEFLLPSSLSGLQLDRLRVFVEINAPDRTFELFALNLKQPNESRLVGKKESPVGLLEFELTGESIPAVDESTLCLGMDVGPLGGDETKEMESANEKSHGWQFRRVRIEAWGKMPE